MIAIIIAFIVAFSNATTQTTNDETIEIQFNYYEYHDVRDSSNDFFNLRVTYDICEKINEHIDEQMMCKSRAYERAISIDA